MKRACLFLGLAGCAGAPAVDGGVPVREAYGGDPSRVALTVREAPSPLAALREIPVYYPPEIFAVYVPSQISRRRDILIGEHWIFMKLKDGGWFPERIDEELSVRAQAADADIDLARRRLSGIRFVIPHE